MNITEQELYKIILEEYVIEEELDEALSPERAAEIIAWIKGKAPRPDWATKNLGSSGIGKSVQSPIDPNVDRSAETMPFPAGDMPQYDDEYDEEGAYDPEAEAPPTAGGAIEDQIAALVQGRSPEEISDLFQAVFSKIPGVEIGSPEDEEPESLYSPGAEGRQQISLGPLREAVFQKLMEAGGTMYRGMGAAYKRDDEESDLRSDAEIVDQAWKDGIEELLVLDGEGDLANREEILAAMKDV